MESSVEVVSVHWPRLPVEAGRTLVHVDISPGIEQPFARCGVIPRRPRDSSNPVKNDRPPPLFYRLFGSCCSSLPRCPRWCSSRRCQTAPLQSKWNKTMVRKSIQSRIKVFSNTFTGYQVVSNLEIYEYLGTKLRKHSARLSRVWSSEIWKSSEKLWNLFRQLGNLEIPLGSQTFQPPNFQDPRDVKFLSIAVKLHSRLCKFRNFRNVLRTAKNSSKPPESPRL